MIAAGTATPPSTAMKGADRRIGQRKAVLSWGAVATGALLLLALVFVRIMSYPMRRDEQLYVPPAALLGEHDLYAELFYNHVPVSAWVFRAAHVLLPAEGLLFHARLVTFGAWIAFAGVAAWAVWSLCRSRAAVAFALAALLANDLLLGVSGMTATNNFLPLPLIAAGLTLFALGLRDGGPSWRFVLSGFALALAAATKASAIAVVPPLVAASLVLPHPMGMGPRMRRVVLPFAAGGVAGALPVLVHLLDDPQGFLAHVVGYHRTVHVDFWNAADGEEVAFGLIDRARLAVTIWLGGTNLIALTVLAALAALGSHRLRGSGGLIAMLLAAGAAAAFALVPRPAFPQYFVPPLAALPVVLGLFVAGIGRGWRVAADRVLIAATVVAVLAGLPRLAQHAANAFRPDRWQVSRVHADGEALAGLIARSGATGKVATLLPIYPLEGGLPVYDELATGQFAYRVADDAPADLLRHYSTTSPERVEVLLRADPPAALLLGFEPELEAPMLRFARENGYVGSDEVRIEDRYGTGTVYLRASDAPSVSD